MKPAKKQEKCDRCGKILNGPGYCVSGYPGTFGKQCATEICQGRRWLLRRKVTKLQELSADKIEEMGGLPF